MHKKPEAVKKPISIKLLNIIFGIYFCFAIVITLIQVFIELEDSKKIIIAELQSVERSNSLSLEQALWVLDNKQVASIADGLIQLQFVTGLSIKDDKNNIILSRGVVSTGHLFSHQFKINHSHILDSSKLKAIHLADVELFSDNSIIFERTKTRVISIIVSAIVKTIILWMIIFGVLKKYLFKPLSKFVDSIENVELASLSDKAISIGVKDNNELKVIEKSFNSMLLHLESQRQQLISHDEKLLEASRQCNEELERTVENRTKELLISNEKLKSLANTDTLTSLNNRRYFFEIGNKLLAMARRQKKPLVVFMCDIDFFKKINDKYGHAVGDEVLVSFAKTVSPLLREGDVFARIGGEEFALINFDSELDDSVALAERIRQAVADIKLELAGETVQFTISFGIASYQTENESLGDILQKADVKLYQAKESGRNKVCF